MEKMKMIYKKKISMLFSVDGKWQAHSSSLPPKPSDAQHTNLIFLQHQSTTKHCYKIEAQ
jgi:hypothetical protein